jgi:hypothetical protein
VFMAVMGGVELGWSISLSILMRRRGDTRPLFKTSLILLSSLGLFGRSALPWASGSAAQTPPCPARLHLAFAPVFAYIAGLFEIRIPFARLDRRFLWVGAELVGDFRFGFHD